MWREANDGGICKDGDEDLRLEESICSRDFEWLNQTSQTPWQGVEDLIKDHLACAVILQNQRVTQRHHMIWHIVHQRQDSGVSSVYDIHTCPV